jgi:5-methylcytosine-specific restriction endonuclease McrA
MVKCAKKITKKKAIPKAIREQCWIQCFGRIYEHKCYIDWCENNINVFDFHVGHDKPESKGGTLDINNLKPICSRCNQSMSDNYTIEEWNKLTKKKNKKKLIDYLPNCFRTYL